MPKNTISLKLNGDVPLAEFSKAMGHLSALIEELTKDVSGKVEIEWEIARLEGGSATAVIAGRSYDETAVEKVVQAYEVIGEAIEKDEPIPYSTSIADEARAITQILNGKITSIEMSTEDFGVSIEKSLEIEGEYDKEYSYGTVTGTVETLSKHGRLRFVLYDSLFNRAVICYLNQDQHSLMLDAWDKRVTVAGKVFRDHVTGRPIEIRDISYVEPRKEVPPGSFMKVEGVIPWKEGDEYPEEIIRRYRDAS